MNLPPMVSIEQWTEGIAPAPVHLLGYGVDLVGYVVGGGILRSLGRDDSYCFAMVELTSWTPERGTVPTGETCKVPARWIRAVYPICQKQEGGAS